MAARTPPQAPAVAAAAAKPARKSALAPQALPTLIMPKGKRVPLAAVPEMHPGFARALKAGEVLQIAKKVRPELQVALPWATLSARRAYVKDKAAALFFQVSFVSGLHDSVGLASPWAGKNASITVTLTNTTTGELFLVVVKGRCNGRAVLRFEGDNGSAEASFNVGDFTCPFALRPDGPEGQFRLTVPVDPSSLTVGAIDIWRVT